MLRAKSIRVGGVTLGLVALLTATSACSDDGQEKDADYTEVCVDAQTLERVDESKCPPVDQLVNAGAGSNAFLWYYLLGRTVAAPPIGSKVSGGSTVRPVSGIGARVPASGGFGTYRSGGSTGE